MKKKILTAIGMLGLVSVLAYFPLFVTTGAPAPEGYTFDIDEVRALANELPGTKPSEIRYEEVATFKFPKVATRAGSSWALVPMAAYAFQLVAADGHTIIDTAMNEAEAKKMFAEFDAEAYQRILDSLGAARAIAITHEHVDHIGGLTDYPDVPAIHDAIKLSSTQVENLEVHAAPPFKEGALDGYQPLQFDAAAAIAPGVVLIKASGHTRGSQMVFVQTASGNEILFLGDVAWLFASVEEVTPRPRIVSNIALPGGEDRAAVYAQLAFLNELAQREPNLTMVAGHDPAQIADYKTSGVLTQGFVQPSNEAPAESPAP